MKCLVAFLICLISVDFISAFQGEINIKFLYGTPVGTFDLTVSSTYFSWEWENNEVVLDNSLYSHSVTDKVAYRFGAPKTENHGDYGISWGYFKFEITTNSGFSRTFYLDLKDENWAEGYPQRDTYILIDDSPIYKKVYISQGDGIQPSVYHETIFQNFTYIIYEFWNMTPLQSNFKIPVTLKNRIEDGSSTDFGSLWANNHEVPSGTSEKFNPDISNNVQHFTLETNYLSERKYSFKWIATRVDPLSQNIFSSNINFTIPVHFDSKDLTRNFRTVWPLTIKNYLPEISGTESFGDISFKDPTTDNQFHNYQATNEGFVKNETFEGLNENIPGYGYSKYSLKAVSPISYNGRNYYWYSGDFNPTTQTDLLITAPTTKTATFKGTLISNNPNAYNTTSQRKFVKTPDGWLHSVYSSLNRVWYEASSDNGVTWRIMNDGQPLDNGQGKLPSIDYVLLIDGFGDENRITVIVYQEKFGNGFKIKAKSFKRWDDQPTYNFQNVIELASYSSESYSNNSNPVLALDTGGFITFVWEQKSGDAG